MMTREPSTFDSLASRIPEEERKALYARIVQAMDYSTAPFFDSEAAPEPMDVAAAYGRRGFWEHLVCAVLAFFRHMRPVDVFQERLLKGLRARIDALAPGLLAPRADALGQAFLDRLEELKEAAHFFFPPLETCLERERPEFTGFMGSVYMEEADRRLSRECDAYAIGEANQYWDDQSIFKHCLEAMDEILASIPDERKRGMYRGFRSLLCLRRLASFPFERFVASFTTESSMKRVCPLPTAASQLADLAGILTSLYEPPPEDLLETLFLYPLQRLYSEDRQAMESNLAASMAKADLAVKTVRRFMSEVPLTDILRYAKRDLAFQLEQLTGGEDWFASYKAFWRSRVEARFSSFVRDRQRLRLEHEIQDYLGGKPLMSLEAMSSGPQGEGLLPRHEFLFSFIYTAAEIVIGEEINRPLKIVLIDGQFYRQENRLEFTDACNELLRSPDTLRAFDARLAPTGDLGKLLEEARRDFSGGGAKQHRIMAAKQAAAAEADRLLVSLTRAMRSLVDILKGILRPEPGSRFDSLQNLSSLDGRANAQFRHSLEKAKDRLERLLGLINEILEMEGLRLPS